MLSRRAQAVRYRVIPADLAGHIFEVQLCFTAVHREHTLSLPVWIPGSYMVRDFSRHVFAVTLIHPNCSQSVLDSQKTRPHNEATALKQINKNTWQVSGCEPAEAVTLQWKVYAFDVSVRTAWLGFERGFFNPSSLCMRVHGFEHSSHCLEVVQSPEVPKNWLVCTSLTPSTQLADAPDSQGFGTYLADNYDELIDSPVTLGQGWRCSFDVLGVPHHIFVTGVQPEDFDRKRLAQDTQKICQTVAQFWAGNDAEPAEAGRKRVAAKTYPIDRPYVFMLHATHSNYGGLEHEYSTALICSRKDLPVVSAAKYQALGKALSNPAKTDATSAGGDYTTLQGLICHEYFHVWCVKRLKPAELVLYDYERENHTELLWFFEGFTSYYDDLLLLRAGLIDTAQYLKLLAKNLNAVLAGKGRLVQSLGQSSLEAWTKYYRPDENSQNLLVSYYAKGALLAWFLDLKLRSLPGAPSLDAVMQDLWQLHYVRPTHRRGALKRVDIEAALKRQGMNDAVDLLNTWVDGTDELPFAELQALLAPHKVELTLKPWDQLSWAQRLGWRVQLAVYTPKAEAVSAGKRMPKPALGLQIAALAQGGAAMQAGLYAGDVLLNVCGQAPQSAADLEALLTAESVNSGKKTLTLPIKVMRDGQSISLVLKLPLHDTKSGNLTLPPSQIAQAVLSAV